MMNPDKDREFDQNMTQLLSLLKKLIKNIPKNGSLPTSDKDQPVNLNIFLSFFPVAPEELDELDEIYDHLYFQDEKNIEELSADLNQADLEFLKRHGIRF